MKFVNCDEFWWAGVCVLLATSPCGISESWGGDVPISDSDQCGPRLRRLFWCRLLMNLPFNLFLSSSVLLRGKPTTDLPPHPLTYTLSLHGIIRPDVHTPSPSQNTKIFFPHRVLRSPERRPSPSTSPVPTSPVTSRLWILLPSLAPSTPYGFPFPPQPCCHQNIF